MLKLIHPFTMLISGPTQSGKTVCTLRIIDNAETMIEPTVRKILYCYKEYQPKSFDAYKGKVQYFEGMPSLEMFDGKQPTLLILDDLMGEMNQTVAEIFTRVSHHRDLSVIFLTQNLFPKNPHARTISLNAHYFILFKNPRDTTQFAVMARQMYGSSYKFAIEGFQDATHIPHGYLLIDLKPQTDDKHRLRTRIFPGEQIFVWVDRKLYKPEW
jgi:hypothetical protein